MGHPDTRVYYIDGANIFTFTYRPTNVVTQHFVKTTIFLRNDERCFS